MKEHPVLTNAALVPAYLAHRKSQTRRLIPFQPQLIDGLWHVLYPGPDGGGHGIYANKAEMIAEYIPQALKWATTKFGAPGDRLWMREALVRRSLGEHSNSRYAERTGWLYAACEAPVTMPVIWPTPFLVRRSFSSMFMPRWACRILRERVGEIRIEQLQDISEQDAQAEGVTNRRNFAALWNRLHTDNGHGWEGNPYVAAIGFDPKDDTR